MKVSPKTKKSTFFYLYCGAFKQLVCPRRGAFASLFSKNPNARDTARREMMDTAGLEMTDAQDGLLPAFIFGISIIIKRQFSVFTLSKFENFQTLQSEVNV